MARGKDGEDMRPLCQRDGVQLSVGESRTLSTGPFDCETAQGNRHVGRTTCRGDAILYSLTPSVYNLYVFYELDFGHTFTSLEHRHLLYVVIITG